MSRPELPTSSVRVTLRGFGSCMTCNGRKWHVILEEYRQGAAPERFSLDVAAVMFETTSWTVAGDIVALGHVSWSGDGLALKVTE